MQGMFAHCHAFNQPLNHWNVSNVTNMSTMFYHCHAFHQVLPWKLRAGVRTAFMFHESHGSLLERRSPGTIRRRNEELAHSIIKRSNHPNMMRFDDDHMSPIEADAPDYIERLMANVRKRSPDLLVGKRKTQKELRVKRKRSRSRSQSESKKRSHRK
jgi:surface protein